MSTVERIVTSIYEAKKEVDERLKQVGYALVAYRDKQIEREDVDFAEAAYVSAVTAYEAAVHEQRKYRPLGLVELPRDPVIVAERVTVAGLPMYRITGIEPCPLQVDVAIAPARILEFAVGPELAKKHAPAFATWLGNHFRKSTAEIRAWCARQE